ncbi:Crp/Fnr family transcriptional regulator [Mucilaginibacter hurinus]|uniref:Crp/Fnr family transcriptional regulator n=1 Tax=Mucilaginibacter hurinus TaxID=2201324 RepID=A0A367GQP5_9SPHI|nr:Crp/Fnr family transcriptional regulator [Mucilaginibacter hurinus]RCH55794.1 Crp/Fnr family transcriptional regulator [Mucilaginibacter hurinus]
MYPKLFTHIKKHVSLTDADEALITNKLTLTKLRKKTFILQPGKICQGNYFILKGCVRMYFVNKKLTEQITQFGLENWWLADYDSLYNQKPSTYYLQAVEDCELLLLTPQHETELISAIPQLQTYFRNMFEKSVIAAQRRIHYISSMNDEELYREFSRLFPEFIQRVPQYMLASYLGFTPQFLSRIRAKKV